MTKIKASVSALAIAGAMFAGLAIPANAAQTFVTDVIVQGSLCVGVDCTSSESFGFDTIRLKENNLRIGFNDTSNSASFPNNDWQLTANDSGNGGVNHFSIDDITGGRTPFRVEAGAPSWALIVEADGDIGIGTQNPVVEAHIVDGDSPTLRLEQDGSAGFTPQTFDIAANEANFFVRDVTNGSQLPLQIKPGADSASLFVAANNNIGLSTDNPSAALHVRRTNDTASVRIEDTSTSAGTLQEMLRLVNYGDPALVFDNTKNGNVWTFRAGSRMIIDHPTAAGFEFDLNNNGSLTISGTLTTGGTTCGGGCDLVFTEDYELPSIEEHAAAMWSAGYLPNVGPTIENEPFNMTDKVGRMLNELETAHIYIAELHTRLEALEEQIEAN